MTYKRYPPPMPASLVRLYKRLRHTFSRHEGEFPDCPRCFKANRD